ncbi:MAG: hypothetical protein U0350_03690 [Caldilineaceae bacterium]
MPVLEIEYKGDDIVIPKETAEKELGLHPGDRLTVAMSPKVKLVPIKRTPAEIAKIKQILEEFRDAFDPEDLADWEAARDELWNSWKLQS